MRCELFVPIKRQKYIFVSSITEHLPNKNMCKLQLVIIYDLFEPGSIFITSTVFSFSSATEGK